MKYLFIIFLSMTCLSCSQDKQVVLDDSTEQAIQDSSKILARVSDMPITEEQLERSLYKNLGGFNASQLDTNGRKKYLESMIASASMAQLAEQALSEQEQNELEMDLIAYKEQLLVKKYLAANIQTTPVSSKMVKAYYEKHPEKFGAINVYDVEIFKLNKLADATKMDAIKLLSNSRSEVNKNALVKQLKEKGAELVIETRRISDKKDPIYKIANKMSQSDFSKVYYIKGIPQRFYLKNLIQKPAKPLSSVSAEIRKMLAPVQLKKAIKEASEEARKQQTVSYN